MKDIANTRHTGDVHGYGLLITVYTAYTTFVEITNSPRWKRHENHPFNTTKDLKYS